MHYGPFTASLDSQKPTMVPRVDSQRNMQQMGQRRMLSGSDVQLLNASIAKRVIKNIAKIISIKY
jgi:hypothetical protein